MTSYADDDFDFDFDDPDDDPLDDPFFRWAWAQGYRPIGHDAEWIPASLAQPPLTQEPS